MSAIIWLFPSCWKSSEWQDIPTLKDFSRFCSIARLNIQKPEAIDHQAINPITSQIATLLVSPLGIAIGKPSSFSPEPMVKFYIIQVPTADNYSDSTVGISLVRSSIELSQRTVESWNKVWGDVINPSGALWAGLCNLGTTLAALSEIIFVDLSHPGARYEIFKLHLD
ncbi:MAG: hypothetical protein AAFW70_23250 [Cyanobacteria bacterium J06635_10]